MKLSYNSRTVKYVYDDNRIEMTLTFDGGMNQKQKEAINRLTDLEKNQFERLPKGGMNFNKKHDITNFVNLQIEFQEELIRFLLVEFENNAIDLGLQTFSTNDEVSVSDFLERCVNLYRECHDSDNNLYTTVTRSQLSEHELSSDKFNIPLKQIDDARKNSPKSRQFKAGFDWLEFVYESYFPVLGSTVKHPREKLDLLMILERAFSFRDAIMIIHNDPWEDVSDIQKEGDEIFNILNKHSNIGNYKRAPLWESDAIKFANDLVKRRPKINKSALARAISDNCLNTPDKKQIEIAIDKWQGNAKSKSPPLPCVPWKLKTGKAGRPRSTNIK